MKNILKINKDLLNILGYFSLLIILALMLDVMFADTREYGYVNINTIETLGSDVKEIWYGILAFSFGAFFGADIVVVLFDKKKRLQGVLILVSSLFVLVAYIHVISIRMLVFISGLLISAVWCYNDGKNKGTKKDKKYSRATKMVAFLAIYAVLISLVNLFLSIILSGSTEINGTIIYLLLVVAFGFIFNKFINYPIAESKVFVIGPKESGKTVFMCGCYQWTEDNEKTIDNPSPHIDKALYKLYKGEWPDATGDTYEECTFKYEYGVLFVKDIEVRMFDFGGEHLENMIDEIVDYIDRKYSDQSTRAWSIAEKIGEGIYNAGTLIFLIDIDSINTLKDPILKYYKKILGKAPIKNKPYYVIITKADEHYKKEWPLTEKYYRLFKNKIIKELQNRQPFFRQLRHAEDIIPVGLWLSNKTEELPFKISDEEDEDEGPEKKFVTIGYDKVLEAMAK